MAQLRIACEYRGTFIGRGPRPDRDTDWMVELWRAFPEDEMPAEPKELTFPADSPLVIEWEKWKPEQALQGSMLTLKVISITDRQFIDYYTTQAGEIYIKVYRRGWQATLGREEPKGWRLVWRGSLDPEFYEEPFETLRGYDVSMTFSDFGAMDRIDFDQSHIFPDGGPMPSVLALLAAGLCDARIISQDDAWIEERTPGSGHYCEPVMTAATVSRYQLAGDKTQVDIPLNDLSKIYVPAANFEDEEGKKSTWREAAEAVLLPLGLHMVQRAGRILIYDTSFLVGNHGDPDSTPMIDWTGDSQTLSAAQTCNRISVTFSPYSRPSLIHDDTDININAPWRSVKEVYNAKTNDNQYDPVDVWPSFRIMQTRTGTGPESISATARYFRITSLGGSAGSRKGLIFQTPPPINGTFEPNNSESNLLATYVSREIPPQLTGLDRLEGMGCCLRLKFELLFDPRYNPFEDATPPDPKHTKNVASERLWELFCDVAWAAMPLRIVLRDSSGNATHYYENRHIFDRVNWYSEGAKSFVGRLETGHWVELQPGDEIPCYECFAQWYDDELGKQALNGWTANRPTIGIWYWGENLPEKITRLPDGMLMAYPPTGGTIEVSFVNGMLLYRGSGYVEEVLKGAYGGKPISLAVRQDVVDDILKNCGWWAVSNVSLDIVDPHSFYTDYESEDIVSEAEVNSGAADNLEVETRCGMTTIPNVTMLGLYRSSERAPLWSLARDGVRSSIDAMLLRTLFSQYSPRRTILTGEASETVMNPLPLYLDHNSGAEVFIMQTARVDAIEGTEEISVVTLLPDTYVPELTDPYNPYEWQKETYPLEQHEPSDEYPWEFDEPDDPDIDPDDPGYDPDDRREDYDDWWDDYYDDRDYY